MSLASIASTHRVSFERPKNTQDSSGGLTKDYHVYVPLAEVVGTLQPTSARDQYLLAQRQVFASHSFYSATDLSEVRRDDRVKDKKTQKIYLVVYPADMAGRGRGWKVFLKEQTV